MISKLPNGRNVPARGQLALEGCDSFIERHARLAALQRALAKGLAFAHDNPDKLRDIYPNFTTITPELARKIVVNYTPEKSDFSQLTKISDLMDRLPGMTQAHGKWMS